MISDTSPIAERIQMELLRRASVGQRIARVRSLSAMVVSLSRRAVARANPQLTSREVGQRVLELALGEPVVHLLGKASGPEVMVPSDLLVVLEPVIAEFERLGVRYYLGGSVVSSAYGMPRSTLDVDLVADFRTEHVGPLVAALGQDYYADTSMILDAIARRSCFNVIHLATMSKVNVFVIGHRVYDRVAATRIREDSIDIDHPGRKYWLASPEDIILIKLEWYRLGNEASERQWSDLIGVLRVQSQHLDREYLARWAEELGVLDLLQRASKEAEDKG